jgi:hypothetical protein
VYDVNDKLGMEAEIKDRIQATLINKVWIPGEVRTYPLRDKNEDDLKNESSNTFSAAKIHDPSDSTSMLKTILPTVGEEDGDLILVEGDTKTDTYSPTIKNYPDFMMLTDIGDLADSVVIRHPNGKCYLDDDKASGTSLDFDTAADKDKMTEAPLVSDILEEVNYLEIRGAINPETGVRFYKIINNVGEDKKKSWRYTNDNFESQADVDNYAAKLDARTITVKKIKISAQSIGNHNMGETLDYKFVDSLYNVPQANYYIIFEQIDYDKNLNVIILSEGMIEKSKYAAGFERNPTDSYASAIYDTDIVITDLNIFPYLGSDTYNGVQTVKDQGGMSYLYLPSNIDEDRNLTIDFVFRNGGHGARTTSGELLVTKQPTDGTYDPTLIEESISFDAVFSANDAHYHKSYLLSSSDIDVGYLYFFYWKNVETDNGNATICYIATIQAEYYLKRVVE